jgi:hypothetical protein
MRTRMDIKITLQKSRNLDQVYYIRVNMSIGTLYNTNRRNWTEIREFISQVSNDWGTTPRVFLQDADGAAVQALLTEGDWAVAILRD